MKRYLLLLFLFLSSSIYAQNALTDSLEKILPKLKGKERTKVLGDLAWEWSSFDAEKSKKYSHEMLSVAESLKDSVEIGEACNMLAVAYYRNGGYDKALHYNRRAYRIRKTENDPRKIGSSLNKFVNIFSDQIQLDSALKYANEAVDIFEELHDTSMWAVSLNSVSSLYHKERDVNATFKYATQAYQLARKIDFPYAWAGAAGNLGNCEEYKGNLAEAEEWFMIAQEGFLIVNSPPDLATVANNLGMLKSKRRDFEGALKQYQIALDMSVQMNERMGIALYKANIGGAYNQMKKHDLAIPFFKESLAIAESEKLGRIRLQCYDGLAVAAAYKGNGQESEHYLGLYKNLKDSLYSEERAEQLADMRTLYETEKKERENEELRLENERKDQQKKRLLFGSIAVIFVLIAIGFLYYTNRKNKAAALHQAQLVKERERGLAAVFDATEEERKRIAKDLHDGIGQQLSGLRLSWEALQWRMKEKAPEEAEKIQKLTEVLDESATELRGISHQMMPKALQEKGLLAAIQDMLEKSLGVSEVQYQLEHFKVENERFDERVEIGMYRVAQELINNIVKHSKASQVMVQLYRNKGMLIMIIEDNGIGFSSQSKKDGIGLTNIFSRLNTVDGDVAWEPGPETGTVATVRVPV